MGMPKLHAMLALWVLALASPASFALDARTDIDRAVELIREGQFAFARTYLAPALVSPYISSGERSRAYYFRGFTFAAENMPVSARKDFHRALEFNASNPAALVALGRLYAGGIGIEQDAELAFELFTQAADLEYPPGQFHQGYAYLLGEGVEKNLLKAREILAAAADEGQVFAMMSLAASYRAEHTDSPEPELARFWYENALEAGEPKAQLALAYMHSLGEFGEPDQSASFRLLVAAADDGVPEAYASLGYAHFAGEGTEVDYAASLAAYQKAADAGVVGGYIGLGHLYQFGYGVDQDRAMALEWFRRGAELGDVQAQLRVANLYLQQQTPDAGKQAVYWSRLAAESGAPQALNDFAWILATSKFDEMRNGTLAVVQAEKAVAGEASAAYLDTLAAAYAETGNFERAVEVQRRALDSLTEEEADLRGELENRLQYYQRSEPWRE